MPYGFENTAEEVTEGLDLAGRTYLVTGCNSGLGYETARVLALRGARIIGTARTEAKAEAALQALDADGAAVACDLSDLSSVAAAAEAISAMEPLDGIIANAGVMGFPTLQKAMGYEAQFFINHIGHFLLVTRLLPSLAPAGRVVVLTSAGHSMAPEEGIDFDNLRGERSYDPWAAYGRSKLANLLFARALSKRLPSGQTANAVHPGAVETPLGRYVDPDEMAATYERLKKIMKTVEQGAATSCYAAAHPEAAEITGAFLNHSRVGKPYHDQASNDDLAEELWERSEAIVDELL